MKIILVYVFLLSDSANDYSDNMSEQVDMVEVKTKPNESDELLSVCKTTNMVANHRSNDKTRSESKNYISCLFLKFLNKITF